MRAYLSYLWYLIRHKWFVFLKCCEYGIPLLGLLHDLSKFFPDEFIAYARYFYNADGSPRTERDKATTRAFDLAWFKHQRRNKHHWQYWVLLEDEGGIKPLPIPRAYVKEMLADWLGAGRALGADLKEWYFNHKTVMLLDQGVRSFIEGELGVLEA